ncbi:MAG: hypothetical protein LBQ64_06305 [Bacteroidales bacterium]|jgi:hypothetical protein|nr:hypothetical protein [Bacteroidales bacterium]
MKQAQLCMLTDHALDFTNKDVCIRSLTNQAVEEELCRYLRYASHLDNTEAGQALPLEVKQITDTGTVLLALSGIAIRIDRHIIQCGFPVIFRAFFDYEPLRKAIYTLLRALLLSCGTTELTACPSFWTYNSYEIKNEWHQKRLLVLQEKVVRLSTSYKRSKLNLRLCLPEITDLKQAANKQYKVWYVKKLTEI